MIPPWNANDVFITMSSITLLINYKSGIPVVSEGGGVIWVEEGGG